MIADDGHQIVEDDHLAHAGDFLRLAVVDMATLRRTPVTPRSSRIEARQHHIDAIDFLAVDLRGRVERLSGFPISRIPSASSAAGWRAAYRSRNPQARHRPVSGSTPYA